MQPFDTTNIVTFLNFFQEEELDIKTYLDENFIPIVVWKGEKAIRFTPEIINDLLNYYGEDTVRLIVAGCIQRLLKNYDRDVTFLIGLDTHRIYLPYETPHLSEKLARVCLSGAESWTELKEHKE